MTRIPFIYNLRSMKVRMVSTIVAVLGIAGVVTVFLAMLSMSRGFQETIKSTGSDINATVLRGGAASEFLSFLPVEHARIVGDAPGVARDDDGNPYTSSEIVTNVVLPNMKTGEPHNVLFRGVSRQALSVHQQIRVVEGSFFTPGLAQLVVGRAASESYRNLKMHESVTFGGTTWAVVGIFDTGGTSFDSEVWCDMTLLQQAFKRPESIVSAVNARLSSVDAFSTFKDALTRDPRLYVKVERESVFYENQSKGIATLIRTLGFLVAFVMGIGAVFAALNTMFSAVSARSSEIATLRSLGFSSGNVVVSFLFESVLIALCGGVLGCLFVLPLNGFTASTLNLANFSQIHFSFMLGADLMLQGIAFALIMGFFGGFFPALRAARQPIAGTLRGE